jgi:hypothetical protein
VLGQHPRNGRRQRCLAVIHVPDRPNVDVRFAPVKFLFCHNILKLYFQPCQMLRGNNL